MLSYVCQLECPPAWALEKEKEGLRLSVSGPGFWCVPADLWRLRESFGLAQSFKSLECLARAAQLRVFACDQARHQGAGFACRAAKLRNAIAAPTQLGPKRKWPDWYRRSFLLQIDNNRKDLLIDIPALGDVLAASKRKSLHDNNDFQKQAYQRILRHRRPDPEFRVLGKIKSFHLSDQSRHVSIDVRTVTPAWTSRKTLHNLHLLGTLVAPRVVSACFSTIWNRWTTMRRFQKRSSDLNVCKLGCSSDAEDSIEHYARFTRVRQFGAGVLGMSLDRICLHTFLLCDPRMQTREHLIASAVLIYATYRATSNYRHTAAPSAAEVHDALTQWTKEAVRGHWASKGVLEQLWRPTPPQIPLPLMPVNVCLNDAQQKQMKKKRTRA